VPKGSFYYFFESKEALALAVINEHWDTEQRDWQAILGDDTPPLEQLRRLFEATEADCAPARSPAGPCRAACSAI